MSTPNQISVEIPDAVITSVLKKLNECKEELAPYMQGLTADERHDLFKMGDKTIATVQKTQSYVVTNPEFVPNYMDIQEFNRDYSVVNQLKPVEDLINQLAVDVSDTRMLAGSEALQQSLFYYGQVREADSKGVPSSRAIYEDLQPRFARRRAKPSENP